MRHKARHMRTLGKKRAEKERRSGRLRREIVGPRKAGDHRWIDFAPEMANFQKKHKQAKQQRDDFYYLAAGLISDGKPIENIMIGAVSAAMSIALGIEDGQFPNVRCTDKHTAARFLAFTFYECAELMEDLAKMPQWE